MFSENSKETKETFATLMSTMWRHSHGPPLKISQAEYLFFWRTYLPYFSPRQQQLLMENKHFYSQLELI